jgi:hypothetical protein
MVFDKIKEVFSGGNKGDLGDMAGKVGLGDYSKYLEGVTFPIGKEDLIVALKDNGAQDALIAHVQSLAGDRFNSADDVFKGLLNR